MTTQEAFNAVSSFSVETENKSTGEETDYRLYYYHLHFTDGNCNQF